MLFAFGVFGLIIGSFLNVLILRHGKRSLSGRSSCVSCGTTLTWYELIPVLSWIYLLGRCRTCKARISLQYPLVEIGTALLFIGIAAAPIALSLKILAFPIAALLVAITVHDLYTTIIPDPWVFSSGALSFLAAVLGGEGGSLLLAILAGPAAAFPLWTMWYVSSGRWMGLGDAKLALTLGWLLGIYGGLYAVFLAFIIGALVSLPLLALSSPAVANAMRRFIPSSMFRTNQLGFTMRSEIPFGPFLVGSCLIVWFAQMYTISLPLAWYSMF